MLEYKIKEFLNNINANVSVVIKNLDTNEVIQINQDYVFPAASTIKLVIMSELLRQVKENKLNLDKIIVLTEEIKTGGAGILKELNSGHTFTLQEILTLMIIISDNTATNILIDLVGMDNVNRMAIELGLMKTKLQRKMMDSNAVKFGRDNYTSAQDMFNILELIYIGKNVNEYYSKIMLDILKKQQISNKLNLYLPEGTLIAHKTGELDKLEHDVGIVYLSNINYIISVLTNEVESNKDGEQIIGKISKMVYDQYNKINIGDINV